MYLHHPVYTSVFVGCIARLYSTQKRPIISGSFAERDLQLKASCTYFCLCGTVLCINILEWCSFIEVVTWRIHVWHKSFMCGVYINLLRMLLLWQLALLFIIILCVWYMYNICVYESCQNAAPLTIGLTVTAGVFAVVILWSHSFSQWW